jgi:hypothetical protein
MLGAGIALSASPKTSFTGDLMGSRLPSRGGGGRDEVEDDNEGSLLLWDVDGGLVEETGMKRAVGEGGPARCCWQLISHTEMDET